MPAKTALVLVATALGAQLRGQPTTNRGYLTRLDDLVRGSSMNPWMPAPNSPVLEDLQPVAPMDTITESVPSLTGQAVKSPDGFNDPVVPFVKPDLIPPMLHPRPYPAMAEQVCEEAGGDLESRSVIARSDVLRPNGRMWTDPKWNYPLTAPADGVPGEAAKNSLDTVPPKFARYIEGAHKARQVQQETAAVHKEFLRFDSNADGAIQFDEFQSKITDIQGKTPEQTLALWRATVGSQTTMSEAAFEELQASGFEVPENATSRVVATLSVPCATRMGFYGRRAMCPNGAAAIGVRLRVDGDESQDQTGLNALEFKCQDAGSYGKTSDSSTSSGAMQPGEEIEIRSAGADAGSWSPWQTCPKGTLISGMTARNAMYAEGADNTAVSDMEFTCMSPDASKVVKLKFGDAAKKEKYAKEIEQGTVSFTDSTQNHAGGWTREQNCEGVVCGLQTRVALGDDKMGITNVRLSCCENVVPCDALCADPAAFTCIDCKARAQQVLDRQAAQK